MSAGKPRNFDPDLQARLAFSKSAAGRARAAELIRERNTVVYGLDTGRHGRKVR